MPKRSAIPNTRKKLIRRLFLICLGLFISTLIAELALRVYNPIRAPARANGIILPAFKSFVAQGRNDPKMSESIRIDYNSMGLRGPEQPDNYAELTSILTVGGSTTECVGLTDGRTWPDHVRRILKKRSANYWINNAGFNGHSTFGHLILLEKHLITLAPDYIVFLVGINEISRGDLNDWDADLQRANSSLRDRIIQQSEVLSTIQTLYRAARAIDLGVHHKPGQDITKLPEHQGPAKQMADLARQHASFLDSYRARLSACVNICKANGIRAILITQPALYGDCVDPTTGVDLGRASFPVSSGSLSGADQWKTLELYNDVTRTVAKQHDAALIELAQTMPKDSKYYIDSIHYSLDGATEVARLIGKELIEILDK